MHESLSGATNHLLRMARSECGAALAFVAIAADGAAETAVYPQVAPDDLFGQAEVDEIARQAWADPELGQAGVFVRASRLKRRQLGLPKRFVVAVAPLPGELGAGPSGILAVVDPAAGTFEAGQLDLLRQVAQRLASHLDARREMRRMSAGVPAPAVAAPSVPAPAVAPNRPSPLETGQVPPPSRWSALARDFPSAVPYPRRPPSPEPFAPQPVGQPTATQPPAAQPAAAQPPATQPTATQPPEAQPPAAGTEPRNGSSPDERRWWSVEAEPVGAEPAGAEPFRAAQTTSSDRPSGDVEESTVDGWVAAGANQAANGGGPATTSDDRPSETTAAQPGPVVPDGGDGFLGLAGFAGRAGRVMGAGAVAGGGPLALVVVELRGGEPPEPSEVAAAFQRELRFDDPLVRLSATTFAAAVALVPGGTGADVVEARLVDALRTVVGASTEVHAANVTAEAGETADVDDLLRAAMATLREG